MLADQKSRRIPIDSLDAQKADDAHHQPKSSAEKEHM
jgi:hypothetical protein